MSAASVVCFDRKLEMTPICHQQLGASHLAKHSRDDVKIYM